MEIVRAVCIMIVELKRGWADVGVKARAIDCKLLHACTDCVACGRSVVLGLVAWLARCGILGAVACGVEMGIGGRPEPRWRSWKMGLRTVGDQIVCALSHVSNFRKMCGVEAKQSPISGEITVGAMKRNDKIDYA